jgi:hypothetical protein
MWVNTEMFREEAKTFLKYGRYCDDPPSSMGYMEYWNEQLRRCINGYSSGGKQITGDHYHYLNFGQIKLTEDVDEIPGVTKRKTRYKTKTVTFPDFWDGDYEYYWHIEIAEKGIDPEKLKALLLDQKPLWIDGGHHVICGKARRKGYSYKNADKAANKYNTIRDSITLVGAFDKKYLYPNGTMSMIVDNLNFMNEHTAWTKRRGVTNRMEHVKASYLEQINGIYVEKGYRSQIIATTFADNPDAARGKDASLILFEECGKFNNLKASYLATQSAVEDGALITGQILLYGTGGDMEGGTIDFESMFYNPEPYNLYPVENIWDDDARGTYCGFFFPDYQNKKGFIDSNGNSNRQTAREYEEAKRENIRTTAKSPAILDKYVTERPFSPREAFLRTTGNIFPTVAISEWRNHIFTHGLYKNVAVNGFLTTSVEAKTIFKPSDSARPVAKFPHEKGDNIHGCVTVYQAPFYSSDGVIPDNMYIICCDPYAQDDSGGNSLGAAYVLKRINPLSKPDDMIVASWVGRPGSQDEYNEVLFMLAEYYNARIGFENDRGNVVEYAKRTHKLRWLLEEVEIIDKRENINIRKLGRTYGMSISNKERKGQGQIYLRDWLIMHRGKGDDGKDKLNLHYIYDLQLLDELIRYGEGNFDRVSAMIVGMYHMKDLYKKQVIEAQETSEGSFWDRSFF